MGLLLRLGRLTLLDGQAVWSHCVEITAWTVPHKMSIPLTLVAMRGALSVPLPIPISVLCCVPLPYQHSCSGRYPWKQTGMLPFLHPLPVVALEWVGVSLGPCFAIIRDLVWPSCVR